MNLPTLSRRSLAHHARAHLGAILGAAVSAAVLIGALVVGDSIRESLRQMALARLGKIESALSSNDRFFRAQLAADLGSGAAVLRLSGSVVNGDSSTRANQVEVLGVAEDFWKLAPGAASHVIPPDGALINEALARQLKAGEGDSLLLRIQKPSQLSQDAPLAKAEDTTFALRVNVDKVLKDSEFGRFGLAASQIPPFNIFLNREILQRRSGMTNKANLLVSEATNLDIKSKWQPPDAELDFRTTPANETELRSSRVFLDPAVAEAAISLPNANPIFTYFVNELRAGTNATPYSMVTAMSTNLGPNEIIINQWLAEDLQVQPGAEIEIAYYVVGPMRRLTEEKAKFKIKEVVPIEGRYADRTFMPDFPGLTDAENCRDWDTGFPINTEAIRPKDEKYWDDFRGTPKAFISLARGQQLWSNRFGNLTSVRWPSTNSTQLQGGIMSRLDPASVGLRFEPVREHALVASAQGQDFGQLFLGFSLFLIAAALMLMSLLFGLSIERRAQEIGALLAIGLTPKQIRRLLLFEGAGLALIGATLGVIGGVFYAKAMVLGLATIWQSAVGTAALQAYVLPKTLAIGAVAAMLVAIATLAWSLRKVAKRPARELLNASSSSEEIPGGGKLANRVAEIGVVGAVVLAIPSRMEPAAFFGAGALLLIAAVAGASVWMRRQAETTAAIPTLSALGIRNIARRRKRSRAVIILLGAGAFIIASIGVFRLDSEKGSGKRTSGVGGFEFIGESTLPIVNDLNSEAGREFHGLNSKLLTNISFVPFRVRAGDDASCLNLNRAQKPRLLAVDPQQIAAINPFTFVTPKTDSPWTLLDSASNDVVPAIGDAASIQWALGKKVGDTLDYEDERGRPFKIRIVGAVANSILQGNLVISERNFIERFPTEAGYRMFLIDAPSNSADTATRELTRGLQDYGLQLTPATERLAAFNAVQNTYLSAFQILGGLGLVLGSFGLAVVVLRNVFERRAELAVMQAVGFTPKRIRNLILGEHAALMAAGLTAGAAAALLAVLPQLLQPRGSFPLLSLFITLGAVIVFGLAATWLAASLALRGNLLEALRSE